MPTSSLIETTFAFRGRLYRVAFSPDLNAYPVVEVLTPEGSTRSGKPRAASWRHVAPSKRRDEVAATARDSLRAKLAA